MATTSSMFMYSLTLQPPTDITAAVLGQFAGTKELQIITASGSKLTIHRPDPNNAKLAPLYSQDCFAIIRSLASFRLAGSTRDYLIVGSDSGRISILEYLPDQVRFQKVHLETFGKSGVRRVIPGQYVAVDPKGRACLIASVEKNKIVYVLNRDSQAALTISSPLEAHKAGVIVYDLIAVDVGYENPIFAALEVDHSEVDAEATKEDYDNLDKHLVYYELDLGLNHVVRKWTDTVDRSATRLFPVPGGSDGPSGVLVCGIDSITYRHSNQEPHRVPIPRRRGILENPDRKRQISCGILHKIKGDFFWLLQTTDGDLFKVTLEMAQDENGQLTGEVESLKIRYFDTVPVANSLLVLKNGFLFVAAERGDHQFYGFEGLGDDDDENVFSSTDYPADSSTPYDPAFFYPRELKNLNLGQNIESMNSILDSKVVNLLGADAAPQIYTICGAGARSSFKTLKHGLAVSELVASPLPDRPDRVFTTKLTAGDDYDAYIILSFPSITMVLTIGDDIEQAENTGFVLDVPTLAVQQVGDDSLIQVHPRAMRHIHASKRHNDWPCPPHRTIVAAATNAYQVVLALSSGELVYFVLEDGELQEFEERPEMSGTVTALALAEVPEGRVRSSFVAVGCDDATVRVLSLDDGSLLEQMSIQALTAAASSLCIAPAKDAVSGGSSLYLHIGLHNGVYIRTVLDEISGDVTDARSRFLGLKPVKIFRVPLAGQTCILANSSRPWLGYTDPQTNTFMQTPLDYHESQWAWSFSSENCAQGFVTIHGANLSISYLEDITRNILQESIPLTYTPRKFVKHPEHDLFYIIEADHNVLAPATKQKLIDETPATNGDSTILPPETFGHPHGSKHWASCIQVVDPVTEKKVVFNLDLEPDESATSIAAVPFTSRDDEVFLIVGTAQHLQVNPRKYTGGFLNAYRISEDGRELELVHKTPVSDPATAVVAFQGQVLAGIGSFLILYDIGIKQMLRKSQVKATPNIITGLQTQGSRIIVSDVQESVTYCVFKFQDQKLIPFVQDSVARYTTAATMVDYETVAGGDKFGNIWLVRCPAKVSEEADDENSGAHLSHEKGYLNGVPHRLSLMSHYYPGDIPTSIHKTNLLASAQQVVFWTGLQGTLGILVPLKSRDDVDFFQSLETQLSGDKNPPILGRDHLAYRSYYAPSKCVIDGDLCESFFRLPNDKKEAIAGELDRTVREVERKISETRTRVAY